MIRIASALPVVVSYDPSNGGVSRITQGPRMTGYSYVSPPGTPTAGSPTAFAQQIWMVSTPSTLVLAIHRDVAGWTTGSTLQTEGHGWGTLPETISTIGIGRDARGDATTLVLPRGETHRFEYTALGAARRYEPPIVGGGPTAVGTTETLETEFDPLHRPKVVVFRLGIGREFGRVELNYDPAHGQLASIVVPEQTMRFAGTSIRARNITLTTDTASTNVNGPEITGQLTSIAGPDGASVTFGYDGPLLTSETWSGSVSGSVSRTINPFLEVSSVTVAVSGITLPTTTAYLRDDDGNLSLVGGMTVSTQLAGSSTLPHWERTTSLATAGTPVATTEVFDRFGDLASSEATWGYNLYTTRTVSRDQLGRVTYEYDNGTAHRYDYDPRGWLLSVHDSADTMLATYTYDDNGNRRSAIYGGAFRPTLGRAEVGPGWAIYDEQDRITRYGACTFTHDAVGHRVEQHCTGPMGSVMGDWRFAYDLLGNLVYAEQSSTNKRIDYEVDGLGRRVRRVETNAGGRVTLDRRWLYLDGLRPAAEFDMIHGAPWLRWIFVWGTRSNVPDYLIGRTGAVFRLITDARGSVRRVVAVATGTTVQSIDYDPFGFELTDITTRGFIDQPFRFAGGLWDQDTKLLHFGARDYDAVTGRWTTKDPTLFEGGDTNLYAYVGNDPINTIDPTGLLVRAVYNLATGGFWIQDLDTGRQAYMTAHSGG